MMSIPRLLQIIRDEGGNKNQSFLLGEISSITPIKVKTNNIELDQEQLKMINYFDDVEQIQNNELKKYRLKDKLKAGDTVLLSPVGSIFVILGKLEGVS